MDFSLKNLYRVAPVTLILACLMVTFWVITSVQAHSIDVVGGSSLAESSILYGPYVRLGGVELWRVVGAIFIHLGVAHIVLNTIMLVLLGQMVERAIGSPLMLVLFVVSGLGGNLAVLVMDADTPTAGASGALYGIMAAVLGLAIRGQGQVQSAVGLIVVNIIFTLMTPGVSLWAHLGGLIAGGLIALVLATTTSRSSQMVVSLCVGVAVLVGFGFWII